jgi:hypothetical protein
MTTMLAAPPEQELTQPGNLGRYSYVCNGVDGVLEHHDGAAGVVYEQPLTG